MSSGQQKTYDQSGQAAPVPNVSQTTNNVDPAVKAAQDDFERLLVAIVTPTPAWVMPSEKTKGSKPSGP